MKVVQLGSGYLVETDYQIDSFDVQVLNYPSIVQLPQSLEALSYKKFRKEVKIRKTSFEDILLRYPFLVIMEPKSNPLLHNTELQKSALTSCKEILVILRSYIERIDLIEPSNYQKVNEENKAVMEKLQKINLDPSFLVKNYFAAVELNSFSDKDVFKLDKSNSILELLKSVFKKTKELFWVDFNTKLEANTKKTKRSSFCFIS